MPTDKERHPHDDVPKFGRLLFVLFLVVVFVAVLTWVMETYFPDFGP
jgi:heme/copper-type cytochrome/quinol oxidase subunit 4